MYLIADFENIDDLSKGFAINVPKFDAVNLPKRAVYHSGVL
jgi:hypothetical protein